MMWSAPSGLERNYNVRMESSWGKSLMKSLHHISDYDLYTDVSVFVVHDYIVSSINKE